VSTRGLLPHPDKAKLSASGEDASIVSPCAVGVFDGVGGWIFSGFSSSNFSHALADAVAAELDGCPKSAVEQPVTVLQAALKEASRFRGSATALLLTLRANTLRSALVGDSSFALVRDGAIIYRSEEQQHTFNFPYQLGEGSLDGPDTAIVVDHEVRDGDIIFAGSDGVFDNVADDEWLGWLRDGVSAEEVAARAQAKGADLAFDSPFAQRAREAGLIGLGGGKLDDVTVVITRVTGDGEQSTTLEKKEARRAARRADAAVDAAPRGADNGAVDPLPTRFGRFKTLRHRLHKCLMKVDLVVGVVMALPVLGMVTFLMVRGSLRRPPAARRSLNF
jgi:protein phosphatase PTC7